jgi:hypothetical protein
MAFTVRAKDIKPPPHNHETLGTVYGMMLCGDTLEGVIKV